jgi:hypothetical protein
MKREIITCSFWLLSFYLSVESYRLGLHGQSARADSSFHRDYRHRLIAAFRLVHSIRKVRRMKMPDRD